MNVLAVLVLRMALVMCGFAWLPVALLGYYERQLSPLRASYFGQISFPYFAASTAQAVFAKTCQQYNLLQSIPLS